MTMMVEGTFEGVWMASSDRWPKPQTLCQTLAKPIAKPYGLSYSTHVHTSRSEARSANLLTVRICTNVACI